MSTRPRFDFTAPGWEIVRHPVTLSVCYVNHALRLAPSGFGSREALERNAPDMVETPYTVAKARASYALAYSTPEDAATLQAEVDRIDEEQRVAYALGRKRVDLDTLARFIRESAPANHPDSSGHATPGWAQGCNGTRERIAEAIADASDLRPTERAAFFSACGVGS